MIRTTLATAFAALLVAGPAPAQDVRDIIGGVAQQYLQQQQDQQAYLQAQSSNTIASYKSYLSQYPKGAYVANARDQIRRLGGSTSTTTTSQSSGGGAQLTGDERVRIQRRLTQLGYDTSGADGSFGPGTRRAIALWQRDRSYGQTGQLSRAQANEILRGTTSGGMSAGSTANSAAQAEAALGLGRQQKALVQQGLTQRGFDTRGADGVFGQGTRNAIAAWQRANDMSATGYLTAAQVQRLTR